MTQYTAIDDAKADSSTPSGEKSKSPRSLASQLPSFGRNASAKKLSEPLTGGAEKTVDPGDPYYVFREDLYRKLELVDEALAEFLRVVHQTDTSVNTHQLKEARKNLKRHIKNAEATLKDVSTTVTVVEKDRDKFARIDSSELYDRKAFVTTSEDRLNMAKYELTSEDVKTKLMKDERAKAIRRADGMLGAQTEEQKQNTGFFFDSQARSSLLMQQQEETLDDLDVAVTRVGHMAETIHEEIGAQNKMLDEMDEDLQDAEEQLGIVMGKLAKFLKTKNKCQLGTILTLAAIVIVLFLLVLYT